MSLQRLPTEHPKRTSMKPISLLLIIIATGCIVQWTAEDWQSYLTFVNPRMDRCAATFMIPLSNSGNLKIGTAAAFEITFEGSRHTLSLPSFMKIRFVITGKDTVKGIPCTVVDVTSEMDFESVIVTFSGKEWVDSTGAVVKMVGTATGLYEGYEMPMNYIIERTGEEEYNGHECWIFSVIENMEVGTNTQEIRTIQYMEKETYTLVRMITDILGREVDSGYIEPLIPLKELQWELGATEELHTEMGDYRCQIIYLKEENEPYGTLWVSKQVRAPLKYVISLKEEDVELKMTIVLIEYASP